MSGSSATGDRDLLAAGSFMSRVVDGVEQQTWMSGTPLALFLGLIALTMGIIFFLPAHQGGAQLAGGDRGGVVVVIGLGLDTGAWAIGSIKGGLPHFISQACP
ncbi:MAG: hypothetical protein R3B67_11800 [Phycisphaerales bacterium]